MSKIALDLESAAALREFAAAMPVAVENITNETIKLVNVYQSVADNVGPHNEDFYNMLMLIKSAQLKAAEAVEVLPNVLNLIADKIEIYNSSTSAPDGDTDPAPPQKKLGRRR